MEKKEYEQQSVSHQNRVKGSPVGKACCVLFDLLQSLMVFVRTLNQVTEGPDLSAPTLPLCLEGSAKADQKGAPLTQIKEGYMCVSGCVGISCV